jgi:hypothetical protein
VHVNPGGGPDRDDAGLPRVDVEIPDDARELDRDVQAYHRELRAQRRRRRSGRLHLAMSRDGMVMPLLICCLVFALITGTLLTFFTSTSIDPAGLPGRSNQGGPEGKPPSSGAATPARPTATPAPGLANAPVQVGGQPQQVGDLRRAILLVAPAACGCDATISEIGGLAAAAHETVYLVSAEPDAITPGPGIRPATDESGELTGTLYPHAGLTAILVTPSGLVSYAQELQQLQDRKSLQDLVDLV